MRWKFIDRVTETDEISYIKGEKVFPLFEEWHQDHFPSRPVVPGVLQIEVAANLAGKLILMRGLRESREWVAPLLLKTEECRFIDPIFPGDLIEVEVNITRYTRRIVYSSGMLKVQGKKKAEINIASARGVVENVGNPQVLLPWQSQDMLEVYPNMSTELQAFLRQEMQKK